MCAAYYLSEHIHYLRMPYTHADTTVIVDKKLNFKRLTKFSSLNLSGRMFKLLLSCKYYLRVSVCARNKHTSVVRFVLVEHTKGAAIYRQFEIDHNGNYILRGSLREK